MSYTNLRLVDWYGFETIFEDRWFRQYMAPTLRQSVDPLIEYTEPINTRIFRKADALSENCQQRFRDLRKKHFVLGMGFVPVLIPFYGLPTHAIPSLPLKKVLDNKYSQDFGSLPGDVLNATALRPLMESLAQHFETAIEEFDEVFGERA